MIAKRKKTFIITINPQVIVQIQNKEVNSQNMEIKYFTDSVYHSLTYSVPFILESPIKSAQDNSTQDLTKIKMNFNFLVSETKEHKKIFDNIGVINIKFDNQLLRYGILVTEQKGQIYVSLIE